MRLVQHICANARKRLVVLGLEAVLNDAARVLTNPASPLVVICNSGGIAAGLLTKTDLVRAIRSYSMTGTTPVEAAMTRSMLSCAMTETLQCVWTRLNTRGLRCAPILDDLFRPLGVVHARDLARELLEEVSNEEVLLRDYVLGVGYQ